MDLSSIVKTIASPIRRGVTIEAICPICAEPQIFEAPDNYSSCRDNLRSKACPLNDCVTRDRAAAAVSFSLFDREEVKTLAIHEAAPGGRGLSLWLWYNAKNLVFSGYYPDKPSGEMVGHIRNENLEQQSFADQTFDLVLRVALISVITFALFRATHDGSPTVYVETSRLGYLTPPDGSQTQQLDTLKQGLEDLRRQLECSSAVLVRSNEGAEQAYALVQQQLLEGRQQIVDLEGQLGERQRRIADLQSQLGEGQQRIADLQSQLAASEAQANSECAVLVRSK